MNGFKARVAGCVIATAIASILLTVSPVGTSTVALAQSQVSVSIEFRTALEPYGRWERHSRWGDVWIPRERQRAWRPYTDGRWVYTEEWGWYWVEDRAEADWGWATYHYGRWVLDREMGWVWLPGQEWGPGFVQWRHGRQHVGWAPLPPDEIADEYRDEPRVWVFIEARDFTAPRYTRVILPDPDQDIYFRETVVINQTVVLRDRRIAVNPGIPPAYVAASIGRPIRAYEVRPRVLPGTVQIKGAIEVRPGDVRGTKGGVQVAVRETQTVIRPNDRISRPQPLAAGERGRLGDNPPKAAQGEQPGRVQDPNQPQKQGQGKEKQPLPKQGQGTEQPKQLGIEKQPQPKQQGTEKQPQPKQQGKDSQQPRQQGTERRDEKQQLPKQGQGTEQPKQQGIEKQPQPRQQGTEKQPQPKQQGQDSERPRQQGTERRDEKQPRPKQGEEGQPKQ